MLQPKKKKTTSGDDEEGEEVLVHEPKRAVNAWMYYNGEQTKILKE